MLQFDAVIGRFDENKEKTGWTYIEISSSQAKTLNPNSKQSFRIKGTLDVVPIKQQAVYPDGNGGFILSLNTGLRKKLGKEKGDTLYVQIETDDQPLSYDVDLLLCMEEEPDAIAFFNSLPPSQRNYFSNWIAQAKLPETKAKRIAQTITALTKQLRFNEMMRNGKSSGLS